MLKKRMISIIVPIFNEEENIIPCYESLKNELANLSERYDYEFIFTDNCSSDSSFDLLKGLAKKDPNVKVVRFSRNFGYQKSIFIGYCLAMGDAAIQIDCDLQDPPHLIHQFIAKWHEGYEVVYGARKSREKDGILIGFLRKYFYRFIDFVSSDHLPHDAGDFRLVDRKILELLRNLRDANPYLRGTIASFGFKQVAISYNRLGRERGKAKLDIVDYVSIAMDGILNHSIVPLRLATLTGLLISVILFLYFSCLLIFRFIYHEQWPRGFTTISMLILASISLNAFFLGIIGEYIGRIYRQVKQKPIVVIDQMINFQKAEIFQPNSSVGSNFPVFDQKIS